MTLVKSLLRSQLRAARAVILPAEAERVARQVVARALPFLNALLGEVGGAPETTPVGLYAALPGELDGFPLLEALAAQNFPTLLPVAGAKATPLKFRLWRPGDGFVAGRFGLREPAPSAPEMSPRIILAPLLGFDAEGARLGFGGGYYDATLAHLRGAAPLLAGGLAFSCQQAELIPREKHDQRLDFVITEDKVFRFPALSASLDP